MRPRPLCILDHNSPKYNPTYLSETIPQWIWIWLRSESLYGKRGYYARASIGVSMVFGPFRCVWFCGWKGYRVQGQMDEMFNNHWAECCRWTTIGHSLKMFEHDFNTNLPWLTNSKFFQQLKTDVCWTFYSLHSNTYRVLKVAAWWRKWK